ncbi:MAG: hypothetical protein ABW022_22055 [Actinoplanes sp.]
MLWYWAAIPSEIAGLPIWALNGLSIGGLVMFILMGLATSRLWTKSQVDIVRKDHTDAMNALNKVHDREVSDMKARYELHIDRTVDQYKGRVDDAVKREEQWREVAFKWQAVAEMLSAGIEPMQDQSAAALDLLRAWRAESTRPGKRT